LRRPEGERWVAARGDPYECAQTILILISPIFHPIDEQKDGT